MASRTEVHRQSRAWHRSLLRSLLVSLAVLVLYFVLPLSTDRTAASIGYLVAGIGVTVVLLAFEIRAITVSPYPRVKAFEALVVTLPMFLVAFSVTYYLMGQTDPGAWSEPLSRLDALYFTLTVFATVGFGDITAVSWLARATVTAQMAGNLVLIGVVTRLVVRAMEQGVARAEHTESSQVRP